MEKVTDVSLTEAAANEKSSKNETKLDTSQENLNDCTSSSNKSVDSLVNTNEKSNVSNLSTIDKYVHLSWRNISYNVEVPNSKREADKSQPKKVWRKLLNDISGIARGGRVLAIMGPSGAGKTTLMHSLLGRLSQDSRHELSGCCYANGVPLNDSLKKLFSMVAQDDIVMGKETPHDALYFSARVRLGIPRSNALNLTEAMIERLHLTKCAHTMIGEAGLTKGISGGEKKRLNIGSELITNPFIMVLDEPTTGLDSVNAVRVGNLLRELAHDEGRTVICTIHAPSSELYGLFDDILLLSKGNVVYHGPISETKEYFASVGHPFPPRTNPSEFFMNVLQLPDEEQSKLWEAWRSFSTSDEAKKNPCVSDFPTPDDNELTTLKAKCNVKGSSLGIQFLECYLRSMRMLMRNRQATLGRFFNTVFLAILIGLFYWKLKTDFTGVSDVSGVLFLIMANQLFLAALPAVITFPPERAVFIMEQISESYRPYIYVFTKVLAELPTNIFFSIVYCLILYWMIGLKATSKAFGIFYCVSFLGTFTAYSFGLFSSALFSRLEVSLGFTPLIIFPLTVVGGLFANTDRLHPYFDWLDYISFPRYTFLGFEVNQFEGANLCPTHSPYCLYKTGHDYLVFLGFDNWKWWYSVIGLLCLSAVFLFFASLALSIAAFIHRPHFKFLVKS